MSDGHGSGQDPGAYMGIGSDPTDADINHLAVTSLTPTEADIEDGSETWLCPHCSGLIKTTDAIKAERARCLRIVKRYWSNGLARMIAAKIQSGA